MAILISPEDGFLRFYNSEEASISNLVELTPPPELINDCTVFLSEFDRCGSIRLSTEEPVLFLGGFFHVSG